VIQQKEPGGARFLLHTRPASADLVPRLSWPGQGLLIHQRLPVREPPFHVKEMPHFIGTALLFHYINRMVHVFLGALHYRRSLGWDAPSGGPPGPC